ncbi:TlpA family protein disulfide reductase [SAR202 cluster bacterium AC-647-N09_OGT_505m]|nr:TlpA family protein disulfide reductase [SAR202 cluster bacterium AC-647-N09_OGT_505m]
MANEPLHEQGMAQSDSKARRSVRYNLWYVGIGILALVAITLVATLGDFSSTNTAPDFEFTLYEGDNKQNVRDLNLANLRGKPVVLNFWAGLCPPCRAEMPDLQIFFDEFRDDVTLIGIDIGQFTGLGTRNDAINLLKDKEITYPVGFAVDASVVVDYEVLVMPTTVFINSRGEIFSKWNGLLNQQVLRDVSNKMLALES